jgi:hypothetical protein
MRKTTLLFLLAVGCSKPSEPGNRASPNQSVSHSGNALAEPSAARPQGTTGKVVPKIAVDAGDSDALSDSIEDRLCPADSDDCVLSDPWGPVRVVSRVPPPKGAPATIEYKRYRNFRYSFAVDVPTFLDIGYPPVNGDGLEFRFGKRGKYAQLLAFGEQNIDAQHGAPKVRIGNERFLDLVQEGHATLFARLVGNHRKQIGIAVLQDGVIVTAQLECELSVWAYFEPVAFRMRESLRMVEGGMYARPKQPFVPYGQKAPFRRN